MIGRYISPRKPEIRAGKLIADLALGVGHGAGLLWLLSAVFGSQSVLPSDPALPAHSARSGTDREPVDAEFEIIRRGTISSDRSLQVRRSD